MTSKQVPASQLLQELADKKRDNQYISFGEINEHLSERGFALLMILFSFPMAIPLPYPPGFTTLLGLPLLLLSVQMFMGMDKPSLPKWLAKKTIQTSHLIFAIDKSTKYFLKMERLLKPRLAYFSSLSGEKIIGFFAILCSISIALPIMFGNAVPSAGILIMSIGLLGKDGLVIIIGIITSIVGLFISSFVVYLIFWGAKMAAGSLLHDVYVYLINHFGSLGEE